MLGSCPVVAIVSTARPDEARHFYENVLGLKFVEDSPFAIVFDANGIMLRLAKVQEHSPLPGSVLGWRVTDISATVRGLVEKGVSFERYDVLEQDDLGIWASPAGDASVAWFKDPDGNLLSLTQWDLATAG
jgi:catechol 2,3-dioxygenase-like lactoylglutathione lyase family enzyme